MKTKNFLKTVLFFALWAAVSAAILFLLNCMGFAMKAGLGMLFGGRSLTAPGLVRQHWAEGLKWLHFALMGAVMFTWNLFIRREDEILYIEWPSSGREQLGKFAELLAFIVMLEVVAYLLQFIGNAICVAVTSFATDVKVANTISLKYLFSKIDLTLIGCEAFIASQFLSFFDRQRRRRQAELLELEELAMIEQMNRQRAIAANSSRRPEQRQKHKRELYNCSAKH